MTDYKILIDSNVLVYLVDKDTAPYEEMKNNEICYCKNTSCNFNNLSL